MLKFKWLRAHWFEAILSLLEAAVRLGLLSGAALAALLGQFMLALLLAFLALGLFLRLWRGRLPK